jgi:outer membrane receptor protein involved in Fe transport
MLFQRYVALAWLALALPVFAQTSGEITGTVTDTSGAVIEGANVTIQNTATGQVRQVQTNQSGTYDVPFLVPGTYNIRVERQGFKTATRSDILLQVGAVARADFNIEVGVVTESVEVSGGAALLTTENTAVGTVIENKRIVELPLNGRNYLQMVALSPNVSAEQGAGGEAAARKGGERTQRSLAVAGARSQFNHYTLDGIENTDPSYNIYALRPSIDALEEFKVETGVYAAEFGRAAVQINVATKAGTNQYHGTVFGFFRRDALDAKEYKQVGDKNPFSRDQMGFTFGGRIIRDKLFFMSNFETLREEKTLQGLSNVAPDRMRGGDFSASGRNIFDPASRVFSTDASGNLRAVSAVQFPNNVIPASRFNSVSQKLLEFYPKAIRPGDTILGNYTRQRPRPITWEQFNQRIDYLESVKSNWFGRLSWGDDDSKEIDSFPDQEANILTKTWQTLLSNTRTLSPSLVNEFRFGWTQFDNDQRRFYAFKRDVTGELGIIGLNSPVPLSWGTPTVGLGLGLTGFGEQGNGPFVGRTSIFQFIDNVSWIHGKHTFKFGAEIRRDRFNETGNAFTRGSFAFDVNATQDPARRAVTGHPFADYLLGEVFGPTRARTFSNGLLRSTPMAFYVDDTWKVTPRLTLTLGVRYENTPPYSDKYRGAINVIVYDSGVGPDRQIAPGSRVPVQIRPGDGDFHEGLPFHFHDGIPKVTGDSLLGHATVLRDNNDFAPRVGLAYRPAESWTVRAGFGAFYVQDIAEARFDLSRNIGGRSQFTADSERPNANFSDPWKFEGGTCSNWTGNCQGPTFTLANNTNRRTPYMLQWVMNVQKQLDKDTVFEVGYIGNSAHKLELLRVWNQPVNRLGPNDSRSLLQRSPFPAYGLIQVVDSHGNSSYHGLALKATRRFSKGLTYLAGFTWSKAMDQGSAVRNNTGDNQFATDNYNFHREHALSQFHNGRRFVTSVLYELPFGEGKPFANGRVIGQVVGGWQIGSIITLSDGTPINVGQIGDPLVIGTPNVPDATGISPIPTNRTPDNFYNIAAFSASDPTLAYRFGNTGRNLLLTPGLIQWDFSATKDTRIREGHSLEFRFEAFNFSNHPNYNTPSVDVRTPATFGRITTARTMREMQFGFKYIF